jgi:Protein of unknown function (DUF 659)
MSISNEVDDLMDDVVGEIPTPSNIDDEAPSFFKSIFDDPHLSKIVCQGVNKNGDSVDKREFFCHWCKVQHKGGWNATKAVAHLARRSGSDIKPCSGKIRADYAATYRRMYATMEQKKLKSVDTMANAKSEADRHDIAVLKKSMGQKVGKAGASGKTISNFFCSTTPARSTGIQLKLDGNSSNPVAEQAATVAVASCLLRNGLPFSLVEDTLFRRMCMSFRLVPSKYTFPSSKSIRTTHLDVQYDAQQDETYSLLGTHADVFGITIFGDGATVRKMPLVNILASGAFCPAGLLEISDASSHMAKGGIKNAEYIAALMKPHVEKLGANNVDLCLMDGASNVQNGAKLLQLWYPKISTGHGAEHLTALCLSDVAKTHQVMWI